MVHNTWIMSGCICREFMESVACQELMDPQAPVVLPEREVLVDCQGTKDHL